MRKRLYLIPAALLAASSGYAQDAAEIREAVRKSLVLMQAASRGFVDKSGCISCHNQSLAAMAMAAARERGIPVNAMEEAAIRKATVAVMAPHEETLLQSVASVPATPIVSGYTLMGLAAAKYPGDEMTSAAVHELAARQRLDGRWHGDGERPPLDQGDITATALSMRALQLYPLPGRQAEFTRRIGRARQWLESAEPHTMQDRVFQLLGMVWAKSNAAAIRRAGKVLLSLQKADGGWAPLPGLDSDAYATGQALVALEAAKLVRTTDPAYREGVRYLMNTQEPDGSWHVRSRALGFQPYFESGFPHGQDQWISAAGSAWASLALALTQSPSDVARR